MRLLLDECMTRYLKSDLSVEHTVLTVEEAGFKGLKNGVLLKTAAVDFDVLVTVDKAIEKQQNIASFDLAVLLLRARSNRYEDLKLLVPPALEALRTIKNGEIVIIKFERKS